MRWWPSTIVPSGLNARLASLYEAEIFTTSRTPSSSSISRSIRSGVARGSEDDDSSGNGEEPWVAEELAILNDAYERIFGFRFAVFVAGRPKSEIIPLIEAGLRNDREAELRRAADDCVGIAADRLWKMRSARPEPEPVQEPA